MKKLLTFLTLLTLSIGVCRAAETTIPINVNTINAEPQYQTLTALIGGYSFTADKVFKATGDNAGAMQFNKKTGNGAQNADVYNSTAIPGLKSVTINYKTLKAGTFYSGSSEKSTTHSQSISASTSEGSVTYNVTNGDEYFYINITGTGVFYVNSITVTYDPSGGSQTNYYDVTIGNMTNGSVTASPTTNISAGRTVSLTVNPDEGYELGTLTVTPTESGVTAPNVTINGNNATFEMPESDVTVDATFEAKPTHSITVNGGGSADPSSAYEGQTVTVSVTEGYMIDTYTSTPEITLTPSEDAYTFVMPNENVTINLTLKQKPVQSGRFERITDVSKLEKDARYLIVYEGDDTHDPAVLGAISTTSTKYGISVPATDDNDKVNYTYANGVITLNSESAAKPLTLGGSSGAWTFELDGALLNHTGDGNTLTTGTQNTTWTISFDGTGTNKKAIITNCRTDYTRVMRYNNVSNQLRFACYKGSTINNMQDIYLYKEVGTIVESSDLYIVGQVNGNDEDPFDTNEGVQLTYSQTNDNYSGDFYCTGMNAGYSYFLFSKKVPYSFSNASDLYGSGATNSYWAISEDGTNESHFGDVIPLYAGWTNSFRLPAGLYTVTVDLSDVPNLNNTDKSIVVTKRDVTMTISPSYAYFEDTQTVTMASNLTDIGGKIYYTTDGGNPSDPNSSRQEYTGPITINATTTFKAVAFVGNLYSAVVDKTFTKTPKTPVITPNGGIIHEETEVTITCETEGAEIYYTLDESNPNLESIHYTGPFTISTTTTVKARAYVGTTYSNSIATAEFVYTEPIAPGTGDFIRVTSEDDLVAGREYIIVAEGYTYAMGAVTSNKKASATSDFVITPDHSTVTAGDAVNILKLGNGQVYDNNDNKYWTLTQQDGKKFLLGQTSTDIQAQTYIASGCTDEFIINIANTASGNNEIKYAIVSGGGGRQIWFNGEVFGHYANSTASSYSHVFLYYRDAVISKSLKQIESTGEHGGVVGTKYAIADDYLVAVEYRDVTVDGVNYGYVWCKDNKNIANPITVADGVIDFMRQGNNAPQQGEWDQSNWVVLRFKGDDAISTGLKGHKVTDIVGTYIDATNYMIDVESYVKGDEASYTPNVYCVANFNPSYIANGGLATQANDDNTYFFMPPKVQEVCEIRYAEWDDTNKTFTVPEASGFEGTLSLDWTYNQNAQGTPLTQQQAESAIESSNVPGENGKLPTYKFLAVVQNNPSKGAVSGTNKVYPMNLEGNSSNIITAISVVNANGNVKSVKYVNVAGMVSDVPFQGVNIVVTEYTDGSRTTSKMLRK